MVKADLIERSVAATGCRNRDARRAVEALFEAISGAIARDERVVLRRFGIFYATPKKTGMARNPRTGDAVPIPEGRVVRFRPGQALRSIP